MASGNPSIVLLQFNKAPNIPLHYQSLCCTTKIHMLHSTYILNKPAKSMNLEIGSSFCCSLWTLDQAHYTPPEEKVYIFMLGYAFSFLLFQDQPFIVTKSSFVCHNEQQTTIEPLVPNVHLVLADKITNAFKAILGLEVIILQIIGQKPSTATEN